MIGSLAALSEDKHVMATDRVAFGPKGHGKGFVGQVKAAAGVQVINAAVKDHGIAIAAQVAGGRAIATLARAVVDSAGDVAKGSRAVGLFEAQEHDRGARFAYFR